MNRTLALILLSTLALVAGCSIGSSGGGQAIQPKSSFSFTAPAAGSQVIGSARQPITLVWVADGAPVFNQAVIFSTDLGNLVDETGMVGSSVTVSTQSDGSATAQLVATTPGAATITAVPVIQPSGSQLKATLPLTLLGAPNKLTVRATSPIASNASSIVSAVVKDSSGDVLSGVSVGFSITSGTGILSASSATTDSSGTASVLFTPGGSVETVTIDASVATLADQTANIQVTQSGGPAPAGSLSFSPCPSAMPLSSTANCTVILTDGSGHPVSGATVTLSASVGTLSVSSGTTGTNGALAFTYTAPGTSGASTPMSATLTASSSVNSTAVSQTLSVTLKNSSFSFTQPSAGAQVTENVKQKLSLLWTLQGSPVGSQPVTFSTSQGDLVDASNQVGTSLTEHSQSDGSATVSLLASSAGPVTVTATATDPDSGAAFSSQLQLAVVGPPSTLTASAPSPIRKSGSSLVTALVQDAAGNGIAGISVGFVVQGGGGTMSAPSATTDNSGKALSIFTPDGSVSSVMIQVTAPPLAAQTVTVQVNG